MMFLNMLQVAQSKNNISTEISLDIFPVKVVFIVANALEDAAKIGRVSYDLDISYSEHFLAVTQLHTNVISIITTWENYTSDPSILVHETNHAAFRVLEVIGARPGYDTEEVIAYIQQYIYKKLFNTIKLA